MPTDAINLRLLQLSGQYYHQQITEEVYRAQRHELLKQAMESEGSELEPPVLMQVVSEVVTPVVDEPRARRVTPPGFMLIGLILLLVTVAAVVVLATL